MHHHNSTLIQLLIIFLIMMFLDTMLISHERYPDPTTFSIFWRLWIIVVLYKWLNGLPTIETQTWFGHCKGHSVLAQQSLKAYLQALHRPFLFLVCIVKVLESGACQTSGSFVNRALPTESNVWKATVAMKLSRLCLSSIEGSSVILNQWKVGPLV